MKRIFIVLLTIGLAGCTASLLIINNSEEVSVERLEATEIKPMLKTQPTLQVDINKPKDSIK